ncbi:pre-peptidase C-terminal domain-containing protein [Xanthomonadaceae bacterium JHOS43]|nr:pre-peptidase C-terminal domain-containing protein [Xanthomonadaceae bacterium JHOS43]
MDATRARKWTVLAALALMWMTTVLLPAVALAEKGSRPAAGAKAVTFRTIEGSPLTVRIGEDHSFQIFNSAVPGYGQVFPTSASGTADMGWMIRAGSTLYTPDFSNHDGTATSSLGARTPYTPQSLGNISGSGTAGNPFSVSVSAALGSSGLVATEQVTYVNGRNYFVKRLTLKNNGSASQSVKIYLGADIYLAASDSGVPFRVAASGSIGGQNCTTPATYSILFIPQTPADHYSAAGYSNIWSQIGSSTSNLNNQLTTGCQDNGAALQWNRTLAAGASVSIQATTSFGDIPTITEFDVTSVTPSSLAQGASANVTIRGVGFNQGTTFTFGSGVTVSNLTIVSETQATARLTVTGSATVGNRNVVATQGGGTGLSATLTNGFRVTAAQTGFTLTSITPAAAAQGTSVEVIAAGTGFTAGTTFDFGSGITVTRVVRSGTTSARVNLTIAAAASVGTRNVKAMQGGSTQTATLANGFRVTAAPAGEFSVTSVTPSTLQQGTTREVTVAGRNFTAGTGFSFGNGITVMRVVRSGTTSAKVTIAIAPSAVVGYRNVTGVQGGSNNVSTLSNGFRVTTGPVAWVSSPQMRISAGQAHACAIDAQGQARCWGDATFGQLADTTPTSSAPTTVGGPRLVSLFSSAGAQHNCGLTSGGAAYCWGRNHQGQLGNGTTNDRTEPMQVTGLNSGVVSLALGAQHTCALLNNGQVKCWGDGSNGRLGTGGTARRLTPTDVSGLGGVVTAIGAGAGHSCAVLQDGTMQCWGHNAQSQLGDGGTGDQVRPVDVSLGTAKVIDLALGNEHSCALRTTGTVLCWGRGTNGRLGSGSTANRNTPTAVASLPGPVAQIAAGTAHTCALTQNGNLHCWGDNSDWQLGDSEDVDARTRPAVVAEFPRPIRQIALGSDFTCVQMEGSMVTCFGRMNDGRLGRAGAHTGRSIRKAPVNGFPSAVHRASASGSFGCAATIAGAAYCWGSNQYGQLGNGERLSSGTNVDSYGPTAVSGLGSRVASVVTGAEHACALLIDGTVWCWGRNDAGQLARASSDDQRTPARVAGIENPVAIAAGERHTCALTGSGGVRCWGANDAGQLGDGSQTTRRTPVAVTNLQAGVAAISAGSRHTCALLETGKIRCWGANDSRQLGDNTSSNRTTPVDVSGSDVFRELAAGKAHTCAVTTAGRATCWGSAAEGRLGNGSSSGTFGTPQQVTGLTSGVSGIATGWGGHSCAIHSGALKCWGNNSHRQLGNGSNVASATPVSVQNLSGSLAGLTLGENNTCVRVAGIYQCWGYGGQGATGNGADLPIHALPRPIARFAIAPDPGVRLVNNSALGGQSGGAGQWTEYVISVPPGARDLKIETSGGTGSLHIFVQYEGLPTPGSNICARQTAGTAKSCTIASPQPGDYLITLRGQTDYSGVTLKASYIARVAESAPVSGLSGFDGTMLFFTFQVPEGVANLRVAIGGGSGDVDLYVRRGGFATLGQYDCAARGSGNEKVCEFANPRAGLWYVLVYGRTAFANIRMTAGTNDGSGSYALSLRKTGSGNGSIRSENGTITCGTSNWPCNLALPAGAAVVFKATAATGSSFAGWQGCSAVSGTDCIVVANRANTVTATFTAAATATARLRFDSANGPTTKSIVRHSNTPVTLAWSTTGVAASATCRVYRRSNDAYGAAASPVAGGTLTDATMHTWTEGAHTLYLRCSNGTTSPNITLTIQPNTQSGETTARLRFDSANGPTSKTIVRGSSAPVVFAWTTTNLPAGTTCRIYRLPDDAYAALASPVASGTRSDANIPGWGTGQKVFYLRCTDGTRSPDITLTITSS